MPPTASGERVIAGDDRFLPAAFFALGDSGQHQMAAVAQNGNGRIGFFQIQEVVPGQCQQSGFQSQFFRHPQQGVLGNLLVAEVIFMEEPIPGQLDFMLPGNEGKTDQRCVDPRKTKHAAGGKLQESLAGRRLLLHLPVRSGCQEGHGILSLLQAANLGDDQITAVAQFRHHRQLLGQSGKLVRLQPDDGGRKARRPPGPHNAFKSLFSAQGPRSFRQSCQPRGKTLLAGQHRQMAATSQEACLVVRRFHFNVLGHEPIVPIAVLGENICRFTIPSEQSSIRQTGRGGQKMNTR